MRVAALLIAGVLAGCVTDTGYEPGPPPPEIPDDYYRGIDRAGRGMYQEAVDAFTGAIRKRPDYAPAFRWRGDAYVEMIEGGPWKPRAYQDRAVADYSRAIALKPALAKAWFNRSVVYVLMGKFDLAANGLLHLAMNLTPDDARPHRALGKLYEEHYDGMERLALQHYIACVRNGGGDARVRARIRGLEASLGAEPAVTVVVGDREKRAAELFGRFGRAFGAQDPAGARVLLQELLNEYGDTEFVAPMKEQLEKTLEELRKQP